ncbi:hypothetical protein [Afifella marina]|uniref:Terminase small subunit n=1 Tax=Afifella marina DSM 2698 TaxID=1120955 RepID=A0A1G5MFV6_AFIMA|nr:hypothetical protein [Afifella marina]MBK1625184.1 hypothetical protein [Afifella marina DSM 2698]MBK1628901.1 hypothetical protein [Afifella marina]MBK5918280.1 hypothetical protein [Afifella marina]RAI22801.1 hypothetical protein CH311_03880 [Afifella marina DSM 2698]SCZ24065.1 hypothetical protein SAMN03080610_00641 [Afifella marina DSM 2698]
MAEEADWAAIRAAYEDGAEPLSAIRRRFHVSAGAIAERRRREGWTPRSSDLGAISRQRAAARQDRAKAENEAGSAERSAKIAAGGRGGAAASGARVVGTRGNGRKSASGSRSKTPERPPGRVERLLRLVDAELGRLEARFSREGEVAEKDVRLLSEAARMLDRAEALARKGGEKAPSETDDQDWLRAELSRRIVSLKKRAERG